MATKAWKKVDPMPKLGRTDQLIYLTIMVLTAGFSLSSLFIVILVAERIAFSDPQVIAYMGGPGFAYSFFLMLWSFALFCLILIEPYQNRIPIIGRTDVKYGPPVYLPIYPLLMKNKPQPKIVPSELKKRKKTRIMAAAILVISFLICAALYPLSFWDRTVLHDDGTIHIYNVTNQEVAHYSTDEINSLELTTAYGGSRSPHWDMKMVFHTSDSQSYPFQHSCFDGDAARQLQHMIAMKEQFYSDRCAISGTENLQKVIRDQHYTTNEIDLVYRLFELTP